MDMHWGELQFVLIVLGLSNFFNISVLFMISTSVFISVQVTRKVKHLSGVTLHFREMSYPESGLGTTTLKKERQ